MNSSLLLDFIGNLEAPKGYNQIYGKNKFAPLDSMTLDEVINFQLDCTRSGNPSSAVGRFQIIRLTNEYLKKNSKVKGSSFYNKELQDRFANALLMRRGFVAFMKSREWSGVIKFGNSLAKEWASLPVLSGAKEGKSYYDGDGLNSALTDPDSFINVLVKVRCNCQGE